MGEVKIKVWRKRKNGSHEKREVEGGWRPGEEMRAEVCKVLERGGEQSLK